MVKVIVLPNLKKTLHIVILMTMDSMQDLLKAKKPQEPPQLQAMKDYVFTNHHENVKCSVSQFGYTLVVPNASLASTLHMETPQIISECGLDKKLFIRIGHF